MSTISSSFKDFNTDLNGNFTTALLAPVSYLVLAKPTALLVQ